MIRILITNQKGGVGKSTISANLSRYFASIRKLRTTLLDFDSQGSSTRWVKEVQKENAPDAIRVEQFQVPKTGGFNRVVIESRRVMRRLEPDTDIVIADLTWNDFLNSELLFEFDLVVLPTAVSDVELITTVEFAKRHQWVFESTRYHPTLVIVPSRVRTDQTSAVHRYSEEFPFSFVLTPPILDSIDARRAFAKQFLVRHRNNRLQASFMSFSRAIDQSIELHHAKNGKRDKATEAQNPLLHSFLKYRVEISKAERNASAEKTVIRAGYPSALAASARNPLRSREEKPWLRHAQKKEEEQQQSVAAVSNSDTSQGQAQDPLQVAGFRKPKPPLALVPKAYAAPGSGQGAVSPTTQAASPSGSSSQQDHLGKSPGDQTQANKS